MVTTERKTEVCKKNDAYLKIIEHFFNRIILQEQLIKISLLFKSEENKENALKSLKKTEKTREHVLKSMRELEETDIIKRQPFTANSRFIIFRKFAIRYLYKKEKSNKVASFKMPLANAQAFYKHIFKAEYIINLIELNNLKGAGALQKYLKDNKMSYYYNKREKMEDYYFDIYEEFEKHMDVKEVNKDIIKLREEQTHTLNRLNNGLGKTKVTKKKTRVEMLSEDITIKDVLKRNVLIDKLYWEKIEDVLVVNITYFDVNNVQDMDTIVFVYALAYKCFARLFAAEKLIINMSVCTHSEQACKNLKAKQERQKCNTSFEGVTYFEQSFQRYKAHSMYLNLNYRSYNIKRYLV